MNPLAHEHIQQWVSRIDLTDPYKLADFAAAMTTVEGEELQKVLECENVEQRMFLALTLVSKERELAKLQQEIKKQVEEKITEQQRKYFLQEQYKNIRHVSKVLLFTMPYLYF
jgi:ATP-dependent Lon protease